MSLSFYSTKLSMFIALLVQNDFMTTSSWPHKLNLCYLLFLSALKNFSLSELKNAINGGNIIGEGGSCKVYKVQHD